MEGTKHDHLLASILEEERNVYKFLDAVFGFLSRRTDLFVIQEEGGKLGFPPGAAERIVGMIMTKWKSLTTNSNLPITSDKPDFSQYVVNEEVVTTAEEIDEPKETQTDSKSDVPKSQKQIETSSSDTYNGADRGNYRWSQTIGELEVQVPVPVHVKKSKDLQVTLSEKFVSIKAVDESDRNKWNTLVEGDLCYRLKKEESFWSLTAGQLIMIQCEKETERWWDGFLLSEPKIDSTKIDSSRPLSELSEEEQMKIEELMWNQEKKHMI